MTSAPLQCKTPLPASMEADLRRHRRITRDPKLCHKVRDNSEKLDVGPETRVEHFHHPSSAKRGPVSMNLVAPCALSVLGIARRMRWQSVPPFLSPGKGRQAVQARSNTFLRSLPPSQNILCFPPCRRSYPRRTIRGRCHHPQMQWRTAQQGPRRPARLRLTLALCREGEGIREGAVYAVSRGTSTAWIG